MIGNPRWFKRRKYGGWGFMPCCWQGWLYVALMFGSFFLVTFLPFGDGWVRTGVMFGWAVVFSADAIHIMVSLPRDERERLHEAFAERNAMWAMVVVLAAGVAYQAAAAHASGIFGIDPVIVAALFAGIAAKAVTNVYLDLKD